MSEEDEYYRALGEFIHHFSGVEATLTTIWKLSFRDSMSLVNTMIEKSSLETVANSLKDYFSSDNAAEIHWGISTEDREWYARALSHVLKISSRRNRIVHNPALPIGGSLTYLKYRLLPNKNLKLLEASLNDLGNMSHDLRNIREKFWCLNLINPDSRESLMDYFGGRLQFTEPASGVSFPFRYKC